MIVQEGKIIMKKLSLILMVLTLWFGIGLTAAEAAKEPAPEGWLTSYPEAGKLAKEKKLPLLLLFTGSDWCPACKQLDQKVLSQPEFQKYAAANLIRLYVDFPRYRTQSEAQQRHNQMLSRIFKIEAYPTLILVRPDGKSKQLGFYVNTTAQSFIKELQQAGSGK